MEMQELKKAVQLMVEGKEEGFNTVYSATYNRVYFRASQLMKTEQDAEDLVQIVFVEAYKNISSLQSPDALLGWLDGITYRQGMKLFRKHSEVLLSEEGEGVFDVLENEDVSTMPELTADQKATGEILAEIIEELPELQKAALIAYYYDNRKIEEIAEWMDCSSGTVKSRLNYARKYMKERIEERERKEGYRLHAAGLPVLVFAIRLMSEKRAITGGAIQRIYDAVCSQLGLKASAVQVPVSQTSASSAGAVKTAASSAKAVKITGLLLAAGIVIGGSVFLASRNQPEEPVAAEEPAELESELQPEEEPVEEPVEEPEEIAAGSEEEPIEEPAEDLSWARELYDALKADQFEAVTAKLEDWQALIVQCEPYQVEDEMLLGWESAYRIPVSDTEVLGVVLHMQEEEPEKFREIYVFAGGADGKEGFDYIGWGDKLAGYGMKLPTEWDASEGPVWTTFDGVTKHSYGAYEETFDLSGEEEIMLVWHV